MTTIVRRLPLLLVTTLLAATFSVVATPAPQASATVVRHCVVDFEYNLDARGITCRFAKRLIAGADRVGSYRYEHSRCRRINDRVEATGYGDECTAYRTTFRRGDFRCVYRYYPWDYINRTVCRHVDTPRRRWAFEESA